MVLLSWRCWLEIYLYSGKIAPDSFDYFWTRKCSEDFFSNDDDKALCHSISLSFEAWKGLKCYWLDVDFCLAALPLKNLMLCNIRTFIWCSLDSGSGILYIHIVEQRKISISIKFWVRTSAVQKDCAMQSTEALHESDLTFAVFLENLSSLIAWANVLRIDIFKVKIIWDYLFKARL